MYKTYMLILVLNDNKTCYEVKSKRSLHYIIYNFLTAMNTDFIYLIFFLTVTRYLKMSRLLLDYLGLAHVAWTGISLFIRYK